MILFNEFFSLILHAKVHWYLLAANSPCEAILALKLYMMKVHSNIFKIKFGLPMGSATPGEIFAIHFVHQLYELVLNYLHKGISFTPEDIQNVCPKCSVRLAASLD